MHFLSKLSALSLAVAGLTSVASAAPVIFFSSAATTTYEGYLPVDQVSTGLPSPTYNIGTGGVWTDPVGPSSWVSFNPNTAPGGSYTAPNGYYSYFTSFDATPGSSVSLTVMADDTLSVYLSGADDTFTQVVFDAPGPYPKCAVKTPNCTTPLTVTLTGLGAVNGLDFVVHQANGSATGLDYYGTSVTPEPSSFLLLGTGLFGSAGAMLRRLRRA